MKRLLISDVHLHGMAKVMAGLMIAALIGHGTAVRAQDRVNTGYFSNVAIKGYDTVAYFTESKAVKGSEEFPHDWLGATWHFAKDEHRQAFAEDPIRYAPEYGGFCAIGVAFGELVANIDPEAWFILNDKLYLQYSKPLGEDFKDDRAAMLGDAEENWDAVKAKDSN